MNINTFIYFKLLKNNLTNFLKIFKQHILFYFRSKTANNAANEKQFKFKIIINRIN